MEDLTLVVFAAEANDVAEGTMAQSLRLRYGQEELQTQVVVGPKPRWQELFTAPFHPGGPDHLEVQLLQKGTLRDVTRGTVHIPLSEPCVDHEADLWHTLEGGATVHLMHCVAGPQKCRELLRRHIALQAALVAELRAQAEPAAEDSRFNRLTSCLRTMVGPNWVVNSLIIFAMLVVCWTIVIVDLFLADDKKVALMGIYPRTAHGLVGVVSAPFLHSGLANVLVNSLGLVLFSIILAGHWGTTIFISVTAWSAIVGGFATWCVSVSGADHISYCGTGMGQVGFIITRSLFQRPISWKLIGISILLAIAYFLFLWGMFTDNRTTDWVLQACGGVAGVVLALGLGAYERRCGFQHATAAAAGDAEAVTPPPAASLEEAGEKSAAPTVYA